MIWEHLFLHFSVRSKNKPPAGNTTARGEKVYFRNATNPMEIKRPENRVWTLCRLTNKGKRNKKRNKGKTNKQGKNGKIKWRRGHFFSAFMEERWIPARAPFHLSAAAFTKWTKLTNLSTNTHSSGQPDIWGISKLLVSTTNYCDPKRFSKTKRVSPPRPVRIFVD